MKKQLSGFAYEAAGAGAFSEKKASVKKDDGFTLVELLIVIVIIGILAAILIPTYTDLIKRANLSADQVAVRDMNMALKAAEIDGPEEKTLGWARAVLAEAGFNGDNLIPTTRDHGFYWSDKYNMVLLVDCSDELSSNWVVVNIDNNNKKAAEGFEAFFENVGNPDSEVGHYYNLADFPNVTIKQVGVTINSSNIGWGTSGNLPESGELKLDIALNFIANETPEAAALSKYKDWIFDYRITINQNLDKSGVRYYMAGAFGNLGDGAWRLEDLTNANLEAGTAYLVYWLGGGNIKITYENICEMQTFNCGIAIEGEQDGLIVTLELVMYKGGENVNPYDLTGDDIIVISTFIYDHTGKN